MFLVSTITYLHANLLAAAALLRPPIFPAKDSGRSSFVSRGIMLGRHVEASPRVAATAAAAAAPYYV